MQKIFRLVLAVVFACNALLPSGWTTAAKPSDSKQQQAPHARLTQDIEQAVDRAENAQQLSPAALELAAALQEYEEAFDLCEMQAAIDHLHRASVGYYGKMRKEAPKPTVTRDDTGDIKMVQPDLSYLAEFLGNPVLDLYKQNELQLNDLVDFIDPLTPSYHPEQDTYYAAEILGNTLEAVMTELTDDWQIVLNDLLPAVELRVLYRLNELSTGTYTTIEQVMAVGTLRILLTKIQRYYAQTGQQNPLYQQFDPVTISTLKTTDFGTFRMEPVSANCQLDPSVLDASRAFYQEILALRDAGPKEDSGAFRLMTTLASYAIAYAVEQGNVGQIKAILDLFDEGPKETDFFQTYTPVLSDLFTQLAEDIKFSVAGKDLRNDVLELVVSFSDPKEHSFPARIFALEAAGLIFRSEILPPQEEMKNRFFVINQQVSSQDTEIRSLLAKRAVDIYATLTNTGVYGMQSYGMDAAQMQQLADKIAVIYNTFANDDLQWDTSRKHHPKSYVLDKGADGRTLVLNKEGSIPRLRVRGQGYQLQLPNQDLVEVSGFGQDSNGRWIAMDLKNTVNRRKADQEASAAFAAFVGEVLLWVYGGEILSLVGKAYRAAKGAMIALPKAVKPLMSVKNGRLILPSKRSWKAFSGILKREVKYQNLTATLRENGYVLSATRVEKVSRPAREVSPSIPSSHRLVEHATPGNYATTMMRDVRHAGGSTTVREPVTRPMTSTSDLRNRAWLGLKQRGPIEELHLSWHRPGFNYGQVTLKVPEGSALRTNGIRSWKDWRYFLRNAKGADGQAVEFVPLKQYDLPGASWLTPSRRAQTWVGREEALQTATKEALAADASLAAESADATFAYFKYTPEGWVRVSHDEFMRLGKRLAVKPTINYYKVLQVNPSATREEIVFQYKRLIREYHPDKWASASVAQQKAAAEMTTQLNKAYEVVGKSPKARAAYDATFQQGELLGVGPLEDALRQPLLADANGFSLAITRNSGMTAEGFNPLSRGIGFNAENWSKAGLDLQVATYLAKTNQAAQALAGRNLYLFNTNFTRNFLGTSLAFGVWNGADLVLADPWEKWQKDAWKRQQRKFLTGLGKDFNNFLDEASAAEKENPSMFGVYDSVVRSMQNTFVFTGSTMGFLLQWPYYKVFGLPEVSEGESMGLSMTQMRWQLGQTMKEAGEIAAAQEQEQQSQQLTECLQELDETEAWYLEALAPLESTDPTILKDVKAYFADCRQEVQKIISARLDWGAKESQVSRLFADLTKKLQTRIEGAQHQKEILSTEEEYYDPYYGGIWEEDPSDPLSGEDTPL